MRNCILMILVNIKFQWGDLSDQLKFAESSALRCRERCFHEWRHHRTCSSADRFDILRFDRAQCSCSRQDMQERLKKRTFFLKMLFKSWNDKMRKIMIPWIIDNNSKFCTRKQNAEYHDFAQQFNAGLKQYSVFFKLWVDLFNFKIYCSSIRHESMVTIT